VATTIGRRRPGLRPRRWPLGHLVAAAGMAPGLGPSARRSGPIVRRSCSSTATTAAAVAS